MLMMAITYCGRRLKKCILGGSLLLMTVILGCSPTRSIVVLLPDTDGKVGTLHMKTDKGVYQVDKPYYAVQSDSRDNAQETPRFVDKQQIETLFGQALQAEPDQQFRFGLFTFYCTKNAVELIPESQYQLPALIEHLKRMKPLEIYVVGHTDRVGTEKHNTLLSGRRASSLQRFLISQGITYYRCFSLRRIETAGRYCG